MINRSWSEFKRSFDYRWCFLLSRWKKAERWHWDKNFRTDLKFELWLFCWFIFGKIVKSFEKKNWYKVVNLSSSKTSNTFGHKNEDFDKNEWKKILLLLRRDTSFVSIYAKKFDPKMISQHLPQFKLIKINIFYTFSRLFNIQILVNLIFTSKIASHSSPKQHHQIKNTKKYLRSYFSSTAHF